MAVAKAMFIFEVVVGNVQSLVESRNLIIKSDFADIFSLELKDPKHMHIVIPEPPPLPPDVGKKGKKKKPPKPKKGKKSKVVEPPPAPVIQSGQSVLFSSTAEFLVQNMKKFPLEVSLWNREDNLTYIGGTSIPWDPAFSSFLQKVYNYEDAQYVTVNDDYNIFEEDNAKLMAKIGLQVKLSYLTDKVTTAFRTLSEDPAIKKLLYTGINSKTTSYMCTMKTTDEDFEENCNKIVNNFVVDKPKPNKIAYADYKNAPGANLTFFNEGDYCCMGIADKPPESIYKSPETCPDIDFIVDYVRKIIVSCNDNMRMLTPRPTIKPRVKATDIDRLCYCKETGWPEGTLAEKFKKDTLLEPCPICIDVGKGPKGTGATFDIANIRGPCGRADCRIARDMRAYIENLVDEDNKELKIDDIVGPCGSYNCTLADKIRQILRHEGEFNESSTLEGLSTQCACIQRLQDSFKPTLECDPTCSKTCDTSDSEESDCGGDDCPFSKGKQDSSAKIPSSTQVYNVYYFTVEHDFDIPEKETPATSCPSDVSSKFQYCPTLCPSSQPSGKTTCSKSACSSLPDKKDVSGKERCVDSTCPAKNKSLQNLQISPDDSDIVINFDEINNPCCVKSCDIAEKVKDFIVDGVMSKRKKTEEEDPCYCDCVCTFKFSSKTTYCPICGGYECLGEDVKQMPEYAKPHPCPVYHKLYNKKYIKVDSPWPDENSETKKPAYDTISNKSAKLTYGDKKSLTGSQKNFGKKETEKVKKTKPEKKKVGKFTANVEEAQEKSLQPTAFHQKFLDNKYTYPSVPKHMGWNWAADDIPGLKPRPKWKPGAINKILHRKYKAAREGVDLIAKKKRALMQRKKKIEMKPTLIVKKRDGEYIVQMEVFKKYSKERLIFQYPYDEKPPIRYTIGKTEEEKNKIRKQRERRERRETRRKNRLLQSTFRDKCQEICLKAYNQAIGLLPLPDPNYPDCPCHTEAIKDVTPPIDSCSCSEEGTISSSDTDGDEWVIEFTAPAARWDAKAKHSPHLAENESQYNYLDYKVKLFDKFGNPLPRYFKGPDGKQECTDLGGFWGPGHVWMEINKDGFIGPDNRWIPMNFTGPDGMFYSAEDGGFTDNTGKFLTLGVDGYIDKDGKWTWYPKKKDKNSKSKSILTATTEMKKTGKPVKPEPTTKEDKINNAAAIAKGKGDKKNASVLPKGGQSPPEKLKKTVSYSSAKAKNPLIMSVSVDHDKNNLLHLDRKRNIVANDLKKMNKYKQIMKELQIYDDICELKPPARTNRASNTLKRRQSQINTQSCLKNMQPLYYISRLCANRSEEDGFFVNCVARD